MILPDWLTKITGAAQFANNPANGFQATAGDALQGIGHSMMEHYRRKADSSPSGTQTPGVPGGGPPSVPMPQAMAGLLMPDQRVEAPAPVQIPQWSTPQIPQLPSLGGRPLDISSILKMLQQ